MAERSVRRASPIWWILALIALIAWIIYCIATHRFGIQSKVRDNASNAIADAGLAVPQVDADGRDITLSGIVDRTVNLEALESAAAQGDGVRSVTLDVRTKQAQPANVTLNATGNSAVVAGVVGTTEEHDSILASAQDLYPGGVDDQLEVSNDVDAEGWIGSLTGWMPNLSGIRDANMTADAERIVVNGSVVSSNDADALRGSLTDAAVEGQTADMQLSIYGGTRPSKANVAVREGRVVISGEVNNQDEVDDIVSGAKAIFSGRTIDASGLIANVEVSEPAYLGGYRSTLEEARAIGDGADVEFSDSRITVSGVVASDEVKGGIVSRVNAANPAATVIDQISVVVPEPEPEPAPAPEVDVEAKIAALDLPSLQFESASATLTNDSLVKLNGLAEILNANESVNLAIIGHTDSLGDDVYNLNLSNDRAVSVRSYLTGKGIDGGRLSAEGRGEAEPIATNDTAEGRRTNRRIEFKIVK